MKTNIDEILIVFNDIVTCARRGDYADASSKLNSCLQDIKPVLVSGRIPADYIQKLAYSLETMFLMQKQKDWVAVADVIEYEFVELLINIPE